MAVIGNNIPSGIEKVTINGSKVKEKLNLYSFRGQLIMDVEEPESVVRGSYQGKLYDGSKLYMKTTLTTVNNGSSNSSEGCTGEVILVKPDGTELSVAIPTYTIPSSNHFEDGSSTYSCELTLQPDGNVYLRLERNFLSNHGYSDHVYYQTIYKLNIYSSSLSWTQKAIEISLSNELKWIYVNTNYIIENNYMYVCYEDDTAYKTYIYGYKYGDTNKTFQKLSTNYFQDDYNGQNNHYFLRKNTNTYIYIYNSRWISITRNSDNTYTEYTGTLDWTSMGNREEPFMINDKIYVWVRKDGGSYNPDELYLYTLNGTDSLIWHKLSFSVIGKDELDWIGITNYLDNTPETIFVGPVDNEVRDDGTFVLKEFEPGTLNCSDVDTPTIPIKDGETWQYRNYKYTDTGHKFFFFKFYFSAPSGYNYYYSGYKCVIEAIDGGLVLYSTFKESDITGE